MNSIEIVKINENIRPGVARFICDRRSPLGNPYKMRDQSLTERNRVCDEYARHFENLPAQAREYLMRIQAAHELSDIQLVCHCAPLRCHTETIKNWLLSQ